VLIWKKKLKYWNNLKQKILIISGGISKERAISLDTGKQVAKELSKNGYLVKITEPDFNLLNSIKLFKPNVIFNALHGQFGEDGYIQTILETTKVPYTHSGVISSSIAMDKELSKKIFIKNKILTPKHIMYEFEKSKIDLIKLIEKKLKFPVVIKPINEGSSVNVFICTKLNLFKCLELLKDYKKIIIEEFISGREIQAAIIGSKKLGAIELQPKRKFYDYQAKYNSKSKTKHIIPVALSKKDYNKLMTLALKAHKLINCRGVTRSDFKFYKGKFYLLEINTQPGMTSLSLVPEIAAYHGINFIKLIELILKDASKKK
jgi:D-alanine-D-alanine ligase